MIEFREYIEGFGPIEMVETWVDEENCKNLDRRWRTVCHKEK